MDVKIYFEKQNNPEETYAQTHSDIKSYNCSEDILELTLLSGEVKNFSLKNVQRVLVIKPYCIYSKTQGVRINKK